MASHFSTAVAGGCSALGGRSTRPDWFSFHQKRPNQMWENRQLISECYTYTSRANDCSFIFIPYPPLPSHHINPYQSTICFSLAGEFPAWPLVPPAMWRRQDEIAIHDANFDGFMLPPLHLYILYIYNYMYIYIYIFTVIICHTDVQLQGL